MNDIIHLRAHLFDTLAALKDKDNPMDIERARAVSEVAQTIINTAKVEIEHRRLVSGAQGSGFLPENPAGGNDGSGTTATGQKTVTVLPGGTVTQHRMRG